MAQTRSGLAGDTVTATLPTMPVGKPPSSFFQVSPPSVLRYTPPSPPPLISVQGLRSARQAPANRMRGFFGFMATSTTPVLSFRKSTFSQVLPPSFVRKTPRSRFLPNGCPSAATYAMSGLPGCTTIAPMAPVSGSPMRRPGLARVRGAPRASACRNVAANAGRAGADVDDVGVRWRHRDRADRAAEKAIRDVAPVHARVFALPDTATGGAHQERVRLAGNAGDRGRAAAAVRSDHAPAQAVVEQRVERRWCAVVRCARTGMGAARTEAEK